MSGRVIPPSNRALIEPLEMRTLLSSTGSSSPVVVTPLSEIKAKPNLVLNRADTTGATITGYIPSDIIDAYNFGGITFENGAVQGNGAGQTIGIVDAYNDPNIASDLQTFDAQFNLPAATLNVMSQTGSTTALPADNADWAQEIALDVEWAHAMAPGAKIDLIETNNDNLNSLLNGVKYARTVQGMSVISMSWGSSDYSGESAYDAVFTAPTGHKGETFVAASGDQGTAGGPEWPAVSPNVLAVGGTTLSLQTDGTVIGETAWIDSTGGVSQYEGEPAYQDVVQTTGARTTADVSYNADPNTGYAVYDSVTDQGEVGWLDLGGTSAGAPQWAALIAIADQGRHLAQTGKLNSGSGTLPDLYALAANSTTYNNNFFDITQGGDAFVPAGAGYDYPTGLGSPNASAIVSSLQAGGPGASTGAPVTTPPPTTPPRIHFPGHFFNQDDRTGVTAAEQSANESAESLASRSVHSTIDAVFVDVTPSPFSNASFADVALSQPAGSTRDAASPFSDATISISDATLHDQRPAQAGAGARAANALFITASTVSSAESTGEGVRNGLGRPDGLLSGALSALAPAASARSLHTLAEDLQSRPASRQWLVAIGLGLLMIASPRAGKHTRDEQIECPEA
jgi:hypothetical protein